MHQVGFGGLALAESRLVMVEDRYTVGLSSVQNDIDDSRLFGAHSAIPDSAFIRELSVHNRYSATTSASNNPSLIPAKFSVTMYDRNRDKQTCQSQFETSFRPFLPLSKIWHHDSGRIVDVYMWILVNLDRTCQLTRQSREG
jgi:hypothetical protein